MKKANKLLLFAGVLSGVAALLHIAIIIGGPQWYRFFGAGEDLALMAENGSWYPAVLTFSIVVVLVVWALYAFSGAGLNKAVSTSENWPRCYFGPVSGSRACLHPRLYSAAGNRG